MKDDFATLKERVDLVEYITRRTGSMVKTIGPDTLDLTECPFCKGHDCFRITPSRQGFHCFQCPGELQGGDIFDFIERFDRCDKDEALRILAKDQGYELRGAVVACDPA